MFAGQQRDVRQEVQLGLKEQPEEGAGNTEGTKREGQSGVGRERQAGRGSQSEGGGRGSGRGRRKRRRKNDCYFKNKIKDHLQFILQFSIVFICYFM